MTDELDPPPGVAAATGPPVVFLHIGTMKSGTSYIQAMLGRNREALRANGVLYPGRTWQDQVAAVRDALGAHGGGPRPDVSGDWSAMCDEILSWRGERVILSMELLSLAEPPRVRGIVESLTPAEVHVIITARDLARVIPSAWQESTQNRQTWTWPAYVASLTGDSNDEPMAFKRFWRQHDVAEIASTWSGAVGSERVHVVVVPPPGGPRDELWRRFCTVSGIAAQDYHGADKIRGNPAVGAASAEFLRRLNVELGRDLDILTYERLVKRFLAKSTLGHRTTESRLVLPERYDTWAAEMAGQMIDALRTLDVDVAGDLEELLPAPRPGGGTDSLSEIPEQEIADAGMHAVEALILRLADGTSGARESNQRARSSRRNTGEAVGRP